MSNFDKTSTPPTGGNEDEQPKMVKSLPAHQAPVTKRAHPCVDLEAWVAGFDPNGLTQRLADELTKRGFITPDDFKRTGAVNDVIAAMQRVLSIEAMIVLQSIIKEDK